MLTHYDGPLANGIVDETIKSKQLEAWLKNDQYLKSFIVSIGGNVVFTHNGISNPQVEVIYRPLREQCLSSVRQFTKGCNDWVSLLNSDSFLAIRLEWLEFIKVSFGFSALKPFYIFKIADQAKLRRSLGLDLELP